MKISKSQLKQIIKEEIEKDKALLNAIGVLTDKIEGLDVSIDFLSAAVIGGDPLSIGAAQRTMGRAFKPTMAPGTAAKLNEDEYSETVCKELTDTIGELREKISDQNEKEKLTTQNQIDVLENIMALKGCPEA